jgi:hypothetical protein
MRRLPVREGRGLETAKSMAAAAQLHFSCKPAACGVYAPLVSTLT